MSNKMIGNRNQESGQEKSSSLDATSLSRKDAEIEFLRQQLELLKQELDCECQLTHAYRQELQDTEGELRRVEKELSNIPKVQRLGLDQAKELAKSIVKSNTSVSESLAQLLSGIYNSTVKPGELGRIYKSSFKIRPYRKSDRMKATLNELEVRLGEVKAQCFEVKAQFEQFKVSCANSQERDRTLEALMSAQAE